MKPIIRFENREQLLNCFREWKKKLYLDGWSIEVKFAREGEMPEPNLAGHSDVNWVNMQGEILIKHPEEFVPSDYVWKQSQEQVLIHELLHFKMMGFAEEGSNTIEGAHFDMLQHQLLEQLARGLFMAKYNLEPRWFEEGPDE